MSSTPSLTFAVARPSSLMTAEQADAVLDLLDSILDNRRKTGTQLNPAGWTCWQRAVWLGLNLVDPTTPAHPITYCDELGMSWACGWDEIVADLERMFAGVERSPLP